MRAIVRRASIKECAVISIAVSFLVPVVRPNSRVVRHAVVWCATKQVQSWVKCGILVPLVAISC